MVMMGGMATERQGSSEEKKETKWTEEKEERISQERINVP